MTDLDALARVLLDGPDLDAEPAGEWGLTVARGYARRVLDAGWRPPTDVPPAESAPTPPARESATPAPPAGGTPDAEPGCACGQTTAGCAETGRQAAQRIGTVHD